MKRFILYAAMILSLNCSSFFLSESAANPNVSFQVFYDELNPYGRWINYPRYGYVWIPANEIGFEPYSTNGYWAYTDYGWTWISDYPWGWATFHYGRWDFDDEYGWYWVPDYEWAPAWVAWANCPGYYGWTPLGPGIGVNEVILSGYRVRPERWTYCHEEYLGRRDLYRFYSSRSENLANIRRSQMIGRTNTDPVTHSTFIAGPAPQDVQRSTGTPVKQLALATRSTPGQSVTSNQVSIYKPMITRTSSAAPPKIINLNEVRTLRSASQSVQKTAPTASPEFRSNPRINATQVIPQQQSAASPAATAPPVEPQRIRHYTAPVPQQRESAPAQIRTETRQSSPIQTPRMIPQSIPPPQRVVPPPARPVAPAIQAPRISPPPMHTALPQRVAPPQAIRPATPAQAPRGGAPHR
jgi:hypothetical protein